MKNTLIAIFLIIFIANVCDGRSNFDVGLSFAVERVAYWDTTGGDILKVYNDGDYFPLNKKIAFDFCYHLNYFSVITGITFFKEQYEASNRYYYHGDIYPIDFASNYIGIPLKITIDFSQKASTFFASFDNEFVFSTSAKRILYGTPTLETQTYESKEFKFNRWLWNIGIGFKTKVTEKVYIKLLPYYSFNLIHNPILNQKIQFSKVGFSIGVYRSF